MANNEASSRRNQQILARNPDLAALFAEREEDRAQLKTYNQAQALGLEGHDLIREPDMTKRRELALKYLAEANAVSDDLVKATAPKISPLIEHILQLRGTEATAMSGVQRQKVDEIGTALDSNYKAFHELDKKIGDTALRTGPGRTALVHLKTDYFDPATGEIANPNGYARALGAFFEAAPDPDQQAAGIAWLSGQTGVSIEDLKLSAQDGSGSWFGGAEGLDFTTNFNEIEGNATNLAAQRASRKREVENQFRAMQGTYGGLTGDGRALLDELETSLLGLDGDGLQQALGLKGIEDLPESEAGKQLRQVVTDLIKPEEGVDYWMQDSEHIEKILAEPAFGQVAAEMGYEGQGLDVLRRVTQQYDGELGSQERANNVNDAYRIFELGQPAGSPGNYLKAATTVLFNRKEYDALKAEREGTSPREATQETSSLVNEIEGNLAEESGKPVEEVQATLAETRPDLEDLRNEAAAKAIPESAEAQPAPAAPPEIPEGGTPDLETLRDGAAKQAFQAGEKGLTPAGIREGLATMGAQGARGGPGPLQEPTVLSGEPDETFGLTKTGTDGWADYELDPDGTIRFTQKSNGREVTVSKNQPGAYYSILEDVFGQTIPSRMKPAVAAAKARLGKPKRTPEEQAKLDAEAARTKKIADELNAEAARTKKIADEHGKAGEEAEDDTPLVFIGDPEDEDSEAGKEKRREEARERARVARDRRRADRAAEEAKLEGAVPEAAAEEEEESALDFSGIPGVEEEVPVVDPLAGEDLSANDPQGAEGDVEASSNLTKLINSALSESLTEDEEEPPNKQSDQETEGEANTRRIAEGGGVNLELEKRQKAWKERNAPPGPPPEPETSAPSREETSDRVEEELPQQSEPEEEAPTMAEQEPYTERPGQSLQPPNAPKEAPHQLPGQSTRVGPTSFESLSLPPSKSAKVAANTNLSQADMGSSGKKSGKTALKNIKAVLESAREKALPPGGSVMAGPN